MTTTHSYILLRSCIKPKNKTNKLTNGSILLDNYEGKFVFNVVFYHNY